MINLILPCAGEGKRLGLPYPKEIHQIANDLSLIDLSLRMVYPYRDLIGRVTITITPQKPQLVTYLAKWKNVYPVSFCYFDDRNFEWPGSILSAENLFLDKNFVLLPDSVLEETESNPVVPTMNRLLEESDLVIGVVKERADRMKALGAVNLAPSGEIIEFCDKPQSNLEKYNGFWGTFGFTKSKGRQILETMTASVQRQPVDFKKLGVTTSGFELKSYRDLGVWNNIFDVQTSGVLK